MKTYAIRGRGHYGGADIFVEAETLAQAEEEGTLELRRKHESECSFYEITVRDVTAELLIREKFQCRPFDAPELLHIAHTDMLEYAYEDGEDLPSTYRLDEIPVARLYAEWFNDNATDCQAALDELDEHENYLLERELVK